ncbi:MAG TPA: acetyltransferase [Candidatus Limnocylindrales bacterium]|nr:acetyltransferase [Candidatus Limnocylindrales bacterium]
MTSLPRPTTDSDELSIRPARPTDRTGLVEVWLRSVRATHAFLAPEEIDALIEPSREYLTADEPELWVLVDSADSPVGFMGLAGNEVESLFLAPEVHRRGWGRRLVRHAQALRGELTVAVNEQNTGAVRFYEACGFRLEDRSELDGDGRPFPLLFMRLPAADAVTT